MEIYPGESKRDQAREAFHTRIRSAGDEDSAETYRIVDLIIDAAKEEVRAELEEDRYRQMKRIIAMCVVPEVDAFWAEWEDVKAKREAAGKSTD